jgi:hypothetical protein
MWISKPLPKVDDFAAGATGLPFQGLELELVLLGLETVADLVPVAWVARHGLPRFWVE